MDPDLELRCRVAIALGKFLHEVDTLTVSEMDVWRQMHGSYCLMLPSEVAGTVAAATANFAGKIAKDYVEPEDFIAMSGARREALRVRKQALADHRTKEQMIVVKLNAEIQAAVRKASAKQSEAKPIVPKPEIVVVTPVKSSQSSQRGTRR
ncbi:hypothetical protein [Paludisphaera borealis]|uniref:Uncharacterized protein n=1 Tax=Paludisphaera borealis TaxID=1387353 RepID=A0A1U7CXD5_9BACT|nr:hypothetical protein [Paludisphaera borealis]APW63543.1 hypothetical protein BSF38_05115 [Paludisphaera borealis]